MATCDALVDRLNSYVPGTVFTVLRARPSPAAALGPTAPMRYALRAARDGQEWVFATGPSGQGTPLGEFTRWLATLCDLVNMGFIPVDKNPDRTKA